MGKLTKNYQGFTLVEVLLVVLVFSVVGFGGYFVLQNRHKDSSTKTTSVSSEVTTKATNSAKELNIVEWKVKITVPNELQGLSYQLVSPSTSTAYRGPNADQPYTVTEPAYVKFISSKLKDKPSGCAAETSTSGEFASMSKEETDPNSQPNDGIISAKNLKHVGANYYTLSKPNGLSCQSTDELKSLEAVQMELLSETFQTLQVSK